MAAARESGKEPPEGEAGALEPTSRKKKKARVAVSIRKGTLLFFPTERRDAPDITARPANTESPDQENEPEGS
jgi:hypothetical protein